MEFADGLQLAGHAASPDTVEAGAKAFLSAVNKHRLTQSLKKANGKGKGKKKNGGRPKGI
ncbi:MAG: hypothetical protein A3J27_11010 [Candidatus Tectomicrobia bacterium RIFCSPLOWO2_12_FULL_69_37]|nr:MAG: hypothetical protein A3J27_11010 [Candidatus Tectomicrobia bacterium RIFCSPLOWO2_12_FULL_69_37]